MKPTRIGAIASLGLFCGFTQTEAHAQGAVIFKNFGSGSNGSITPIAYVTDIYGNRLSGTGYSVQLYYGPAGVAANELTPLVSSIQGILTGAQAGLFGAPTIPIPGIGIGEVATLQVRDWGNVGGLYNRWEDSPDLVDRRASNLFEVRLGDPANLVPGALPTLVGLQPFYVVPEPSTAALILAGSALCLFIRPGRRAKTSANI